MFEQLTMKVDRSLRIAKLPNDKGITRDKHIIDEEVDKAFKIELQELLKGL